MNGANREAPKTPGESEVESQLIHNERAGSFIERPALEVVAKG
jgi:hypothetical protein